MVEAVRRSSHELERCGLGLVQADRESRSIAPNLPAQSQACVISPAVTDSDGFGASTLLVVRGTARSSISTRIQGIGVGSGVGEVGFVGEIVGNGKGGRGGNGFGVMGGEVGRIGGAGFGTPGAL